MKSFESRQSYNPTEQDEQSGLREFSLEAEAGSTEQDFLGTKLSLADMLIKNPAFKSEKAYRALSKLKEAWKSAEENIPEELKNELRHERRDASTQDPVHISSIIADAPARQPGLASMLSSQDADEEEETGDGEEADAGLATNPSVYKKAMARGFVAALVLLMLFMLFLMVRHN